MGYGHFVRTFIQNKPSSILTTEIRWKMNWALQRISLCDIARVNWNAYANKFQRRFVCPLQCLQLWIAGGMWNWKERELFFNQQSKFVKISHAHKKRRVTFVWLNANNVFKTHLINVCDIWFNHVKFLELQKNAETVRQGLPKQVVFALTLQIKLLSTVLCYLNNLSGPKSPAKKRFVLFLNNKLLI